MWRTAFGAFLVAHELLTTSSGLAGRAPAARAVRAVSSRPCWPVPIATTAGLVVAALCTA
jgi:uncharacterized membrane protein YidH (DUF202 family)